MAEAIHRLKPLPFHEKVAAYFEAQEQAAWDWFASTKANHDYENEVRLNLLKNSYRLEPATHPIPYENAASAASILTPGVSVILYQTSGQTGPNASILCLGNEAHIVFEGNILALLEPDELRAVIGHELAHYRLWHVEGARFHVADRLAQAMATDPRAEPSHVETARALRLYTEIYADRGALAVSSSIAPVITALVKIQTNFGQVDPEGFLRQADEIFAKSKVKTEGVSHPEAFIRARSIRAWAEGSESADVECRRMIEGAYDMDHLTLVQQSELQILTRQWFDHLFAEKELRTDTTLAHARLFFPDFDFRPDDVSDDTIFNSLTETSPSVRDYFCFLLLDFIAVDKDMGDQTLKAAFSMARRCRWENRLESLAVKELKIKKTIVREMRTAALGPEEETKNG